MPDFLIFQSGNPVFATQQELEDCCCTGAPESCPCTTWPPASWPCNGLIETYAYNFEWEQKTYNNLDCTGTVTGGYALEYSGTVLASSSQGCTWIDDSPTVARFRTWSTSDDHWGPWSDFDSASVRVSLFTDYWRIRALGSKQLSNYDNSFTKSEGRTPVGEYNTTKFVFTSSPFDFPGCRVVGASASRQYIGGATVS